MSDAMKTYDELRQREREREGKYLDNGAPEDIEHLRGRAAPRPIESALEWMFSDGSMLRVRKQSGRRRLYLG